MGEGVSVSVGEGVSVGNGVSEGRGVSEGDKASMEAGAVTVIVGVVDGVGDSETGTLWRNRDVVLAGVGQLLFEPGGYPPPAAKSEQAALAVSVCSSRIETGPNGVEVGGIANK